MWALGCEFYCAQRMRLNGLIIPMLLLSFCTYAQEAPLSFQVTPFDKQGVLWPGNCGIGGVYGGLCSIGNGGIPPETDPDTTPFFHGFVTINGVGYWHTIVGDPADGFAMEAYVERNAPGGVTPSESGGRNSMFWGADADLELFSGNGWDPLGLDPARNNVDFTGNGSGDPRKAIVRQVMGGTWDNNSKTWQCGGDAYCSEFVKGTRAYKPIIRQEINDVAAGMTHYFELDMSAIDYQTNTVAANIVNTVSLVSAPVGDFDMSVHAQDGHYSVTAGRYIYQPCANPVVPWNNCWIDAQIEDGTWQYDEGSYDYVDGGTDPMTYDWGYYWDPDQNPLGPGNEAKCDSGMITASCP